MNRCLPPAAMVYKELCQAAGGKAPVSWDLHRQYLIYRCQWHKRDTIHQSKWDKPKFKPWFAVANADRFPYLFPSKHPEFELPDEFFCN